MSRVPECMRRLAINLNTNSCAKTMKLRLICMMSFSIERFNMDFRLLTMRRLVVDVGVIVVRWGKEHCVVGVQQVGKSRGAEKFVFKEAPSTKKTEFSGDPISMI